MTRSVTGLVCVRPFIRVASFDMDAGFNDIEGAVRALEAEGHTCQRDDAKIRRLFGFEVTTSFLVR